MPPSLLAGEQLRKNKGVILGLYLVPINNIPGTYINLITRVNEISHAPGMILNFRLVFSREAGKGNT